MRPLFLDHIKVRNGKLIAVVMAVLVLMRSMKRIER